MFVSARGLFYSKEGDPVAAEDMKRKLTAILSADVQGYSRLMGDDEQATVETITAYRKVMTDLIQDHHGKVVDAKGDNVLAEFPSVVGAIQCAVEIQKELTLRNTDLSEHRRMEFRIGINSGDVIEKEDTIYGDGVNIAARLESLAEGGGICISGTAFDQVGKKLPLGYEYMGEQTVKNIENPVRAYKVLVEPEAVGKVIGEKTRLKVWHWTAIFGLVVLILVVGVLGLWEFYVRPDVAPASVEKMAYPLPDKPSIAVLPFDNMSKEPDQEYFCDGITEEIITALAKVPGLFVIARNSTFTYKGKPVKIQQVAEDLGVRYVLEGSVRKSEDKVRITAQLIDAISGKHLWAERYDRLLKDIFVVQDEITFKILESLHIKISGDDLIRSCSRGTNNIDAYLKVLQARANIYRQNPEGIIVGRKLSEEAVAIDPEYSTGYCLLAFTYLNNVLHGGSKSPKEDLKLAFEFTEKSLSFDSSCALPYLTLTYCYVLTRQHAKALAACKKAIEFDPNDAFAYTTLSWVCHYSGNPEEAMIAAEKALRLNPKPPSFYQTHLAMAYNAKGMYEDAIHAFKKALSIQPNSIPAHLRLAACYISLNREGEARDEIIAALKINPRLSLGYLAKMYPYKNKADLEQMINALRKAGLK
jgi:adenylate cyclase